jgi:hypothetical protein
MKTHVIKWWSLAAVGIAFAAGAQAGPTLSPAIGPGRDSLPFTEGPQLAPVPAPHLEVLPRAAIHSLLQNAGAPLGAAPGTNLAPVQLATAAPTNAIAANGSILTHTNHTVSVICVIGGESLFKVIIVHPAANAS